MEKHNFAIAEMALQIPIAAPIERVWKALTEELEQWWPRSFCTNPQRVQQFVMEFQLGGRMYEDWGQGNGWLWWTINKIDSVAHSFSAWGLEDAASTTAVTFSLAAVGAQTVLKIHDHTWGALDAKQVLASHEGGWRQLFEGAFKPYAEKHL